MAARRLRCRAAIDAGIPQDPTPGVKYAGEAVEGLVTKDGETVYWHVTTTAYERITRKLHPRHPSVCK